MDQVVLVVDNKSIGQLIRLGIELEEYAIQAIFSTSTELLQAYLRKGLTADQKLVMLQPLVRKGLLDLKESEVFRLEDYSIGMKGKEALMAIGVGIQVVDMGDGVVSDFDWFIGKY